MQKFRAKQTVLVVALKAKALNNSSKSQLIIFNLPFTCNFTFNITIPCFSTLLAFILPLFMKK